MPYIAGTPEAIQARLGRKDSKNFATTCRGINTATGAQCRRELSKNINSPTSGIITFVNGEEAFFCWQHKEQAKDMIFRHTASWRLRRNQQGRTSLDTLIETVELKVGSNNGSRNGKTPVVAATATATATSGKKDTVGFAAVGPEAAKLTPDSLLENHSQPSNAEFPKRKERSFFYKLFLCCFGHDSQEVDPKGTSLGARRRRFTSQRVDLGTAPMAPPLPHMTPEKIQPKPSALAQSPLNSKNEHKAKTPVSAHNKPLSTSQKAPQKQSLFSIIPNHLTPKTALLLQQELLKPFSEKDEPGYIYIFWLQDKPTGESSTTGNKGKSKITVTVSPQGGLNPENSKRVLFKIGRANNVQRRLHQWTEQCNYDLSLVRYYPHVSSSTIQKPLKQKSTNADQTALEPRKVPNVHKIERLIHLELRDDPLVTPPEFDNPCKACGRKHKEWFSVEATREGITAVDGAIKRWIKWGEDNVNLYDGHSFDPKTGTKTKVSDLPTLSVSPGVDRPGGPSANSPNSKKKVGPKAMGVVESKTRKVSRNMKNARRQRQLDEEASDWSYRTETDDENEEWVEVARVRTGEKEAGKGQKKVQVYRD